MKGQKIGWRVLPFFGKYIVERKIGKGAGSIIWSAYDTKDKRWVAIKQVMKTEPNYRTLVERMGDEFKKNQRMQQTPGFEEQNIVKIYREEAIIGWWNPWLPKGKILVMELIEGPDLYHAMKKQSTRPLPKTILKSYYDIARALDFMHSLGYVHCDVDPQNIVLDKGERAVLIDFGLTRMAGSELTPGQLGKNRFMAPEQIVGGELTTKSDVCSLGRVMYWAMGGNLYEQVEGENVLRADFIKKYDAAAEERLRKKNPTFDQDLDEIIYSSMAPDHEKRPSMKEVINVLRSKLTP